MRKALLIIDVQNDYFPGGALALEAMPAAAENCRLLMEKFRADYAPVIHVQHFSTHHGAKFFVPGTKGSTIHDSVEPTPYEAVIAKASPNAFHHTWLLGVLQYAGVGELLVCGAMTHTCIDSTVRCAFDLGYACTVASDACAASDLDSDGSVIKAAEVQAAFLAALRLSFAGVQTTKELLVH
jgi:nicotinamidase-related amidase